MKKRPCVNRTPREPYTIQGVPPDHGTYALIYRCDTPFQVRVGKLGPASFCIGHWIYVGSAFGPGGLKSRLGHHLTPSLRLHWHVDYIKHALRPIEIWMTTDAVKQEHAWADVFARLKGASCPIAGFGASDCTCHSHLIHLPHRPGFGGFKKKVRGVQKGNLIRVPIMVLPD